jgi:hypothetical protein
MAGRHDDDLKDSFYLYIMRNSIGAGLKSQYTPNGHMPDRLSELMKEIEAGSEAPGADKHDGEDKAAGQEPHKHVPPARRRIHRT